MIVKLRTDLDEDARHILDNAARSARRISSWPVWKRAARRDDMPKKKPAPKPRRTHVVSYKALGGHSDAYACSCGWESEGYWDLPEAAWGEWLVHAFDSKTPVEPKDHAQQNRLVREREQKRQELLRQREAIDRRLERMKPWTP